MRITRPSFFTASISFFLLLVCQNLLADTLYLNSAGDDYIGQGATRSLDSPDFTFTATQQGGDNSIQISLDDGSEYWTVNFSAANDAVVTTGNYEDATRFHFSRPPCQV